MSRDFVIFTDTSADLPEQYIRDNQLGLLSLSFTIGGETYLCSDMKMTEREFYAKMRAGEAVTTIQVNPDQAEQKFEQVLREDKDILYLAFSSALSGSCNSGAMAARELQQRYPQAKIIVVDTLCASLGEGLLVHKAVQMKQQGLTLEEIARWAEANKLHVCHRFTVDDLNHLHRGGRVSKTTAVVGTLLGIKPVLHVSNEGKLVPTGKVRGRKQSLISLVDSMAKTMGSYENDTVFISHGDCVEDANFVADLIRERLKVRNFLIHFVDPTIGAHSGPGTVALFFMGEER